MSRMLSKMNLISVVQQLPKEDIETIQGYVEMIEEENQELKSQLRGTTHCFDEEEHNKLKEEITNLSKDVDMWNAKYNDMFDENRMLKKQVAGKIEISENQQKKFIKWLEDYINLFDKKDIY